MEASPYQSPGVPTAFALPENPQKVMRVAKYQKWIIVALFGNAIMYVIAIGIYFTWIYTTSSSGPHELPPAVESILGALAIIEPFLGLFTFVATFILARQFFSRPISFLIMWVGNLPFLFIIALPLLNLRASRYLNQEGIEAGFLGTNLEKLRDQIAQAEAEAEDDE
ncbi:hypothetical protein [Bremerella sp.]|uniref:hypothetical protein n=1 Tax=Bremerella sp. TaxID=2795602 RepID=UPI00391A4317